MNNDINRQHCYIIKVSVNQAAASQLLMYFSHGYLIPYFRCKFFIAVCTNLYGKIVEFYKFKLLWKYTPYANRPHSYSFWWTDCRCGKRLSTAFKWISDSFCFSCLVNFFFKKEMLLPSANEVFGPAHTHIHTSMNSYISFVFRNDYQPGLVLFSLLYISTFASL